MHQKVIPLSELQAGVKIGKRTAIAIDFQELWVIIQFDDDYKMTLRNMPENTVAISYPMIEIDNDNLYLTGALNEQT